MEKRFTQMENIHLLNETLKIMHDGFYLYEDEKKTLKLNYEEMHKAEVLLPDDIQKIKDSTSSQIKNSDKKCKITVSTDDSFSAAIRMKEEIKSDVLVLNFANPYSPGGGVRYGARAQEEDLCRKSSLLLSLESENAQSYYNYNSAHESFTASDAVIISPEVEIIKDKDHNFLQDSVTVSVITCPAPMLMNAPENFNHDEYVEIFSERIKAILLAAAKFNYRNLILGAFGCGAFRNDPKIVAQLFKSAIDEFRFEDMDADICFDNIEFAILSSKVSPSRNYKEFSKVF